MTTSPFDLPLTHIRDSLPAELADQYLSPADVDYEIVLGGKMAVIWHRPGWLYPVFWLLSKGDVLFPETGKGVPTILVVAPGRDSGGGPIQTWERTFHFPGGVRRRYKSTMTYDKTSARVHEIQGPWGIFEEAAEVRFTPPGVLEFITVASRLRLGRLRIPIPRLLWITAHVVQSVIPDKPGTSRVTLTITHSLLGPIFGYDGLFRKAKRRRHG